MNYVVFGVISGRSHVKNSIPYLNDYLLYKSYISPQTYLGISYMSRQKFASSVPWAAGELQSSPHIVSPQCPAWSLGTRFRFSVPHLH